MTTSAEDAVYCEGCLWRLRPSDAVQALRPVAPGEPSVDRVPFAFAHVGHEPPGFRAAGRGTLARLLDQLSDRSSVTYGRSDATVRRLSSGGI
jgi:hypothetical protein